jgi:hypothetical protein
MAAAYLRAMNRYSVLLRVGLLASAGLLQACVTSPYYTPAAAGSVYYVQDPWHYRNSYHDCYQVWYGCPRPYYGYGYGHGYGHGYDHKPAPPARPKPPPEKPVDASKPPRLIRLGAGGSSAPGQVIRQPSPAQPPPKPKPGPVQAPVSRPLPPTNKPAPPRQPQQSEPRPRDEQSLARQERQLRARVLRER